LIGALQIGKDIQTGRLQEAVVQHRAIRSWQKLRFARTGQLWPDQSQQHVTTWPENTAVCNCTGITRGQLTNAITAGCVSVDALAQRTGASTVCGTCKPLLAQMLGTDAALEPVEAASTLQLWAVIACVFALIVIAPITDLPWRESFYKQFTGYSLLGMTVLTLTLPLRKRLPTFSAGRFVAWRSLHVIVGALAVIALLFHTGGRVGSNLNLLLLSTFAALIILGAVTAGVMAVEHRLGSSARARWNWLHLLLFWPLPVLLGVHVLKTYYF
jgi:nitrite reductase (NADH) large subunit